LYRSFQPSEAAVPPAILPREEVVSRLLAVVRRQGYDGTSLAELSKVTGLGKSSLYHHFPKGKDDMVAAVLDHMAESLEQDAFAAARAPGPPAARLRRLAEAVDAFYGQGRETCLLASLTVGDGSKVFRKRVRAIFQAWIEAIAAPLHDAGLAPGAATRQAQDAVARIEGALVLTHSLGDPDPFRRAVRALPDLLAAS